MANPQPTDAHLRVAHSILEEVMASDFTKRQRKILDLILRLSWGCGKKYAIIPRQRDFEAVGVREGHVRAELDWLREAKVITISGDNYSFNKDYDQWRVSRAMGFTPEKLTELVRLNLDHHRENLTEMVSSDDDLPKQEDGTYQSSKKELTKVVSSPDTNLASPKENLKKIKEKSNVVSIDKSTEKQEENPDKISSSGQPPVSPTLGGFQKKEPTQLKKETLERATKTESGKELPAKQLWKEALSVLEKNYTTPSNYHSWLEGSTAYGFKDGSLCIQAPSEYVAQELHFRFKALLEKVLADIVGRPVKVRVSATT